MRIDENKFMKVIEQNGRIPMAKMAKIFNVTETACRRKLKKLEEKGLITGYRAEIDWKKVKKEEEEEENEN